MKTIAFLWGALCSLGLIGAVAKSDSSSGPAGPQISITGKTYVEKNDKIRLVCNATGAGDSLDSVDWFHNGNKLTTAKNRKVFIQAQVSLTERSISSILEVEKADMDDAGTYVCRTSDMQVTSAKLTVLQVQETPGNPDEVDCPSGWTTVDRGCYRFVTEPHASWAGANDNCQKHKGQLVSIAGDREKKKLEQHLNDHYLEQKNWWIGLQKVQGTKDEWQWLDGASDRSATWDDHRKKIRKDTYCGLLDFSKQQLRVSNWICTRMQPYICEVIPTTKTPNLVTTTHNSNIEGATVIDPRDMTINAEETVGEGDILGFHKANGPKTSVTGGLFSSMMTAVLSRGDQDTSQKDGSTPEGNRPDAKVSPTVDAFVPSTEFTVNKGAIKEIVVSERETTQRPVSERLTTQRPVSGRETTQRPVSEQKYTINTAYEHQSTTKTVSGQKSTLNTAYEHESTTKTVSGQKSTLNTVYGQKITSKTVAGLEQTTQTNVELYKSTTDLYNSGGTEPERLSTPVIEGRSNVTGTHGVSTTLAPQTEPTWTSPDTPQPTMVDWNRAYQKFEGCYIPGTGGSLRTTVTTAKRIYKDGLRYCPKMRIGRITWPSTRAEEMANVSCANGQGFATFNCSGEPVCWRGEPDIAGCSSKKLQAVLRKAHIPGNGVSVSPPSVEETIELTSLLSEVTEAESSTMEDVLVTSQLLTSLTRPRGGHLIKRKEQVEAVIKNVVKAGSNLVSGRNAALWKGMSREDRVRSASSLLVAIETAAMSMAEQIDQPTVIVTNNTDIEVEVRVVDTDLLQDETQNLVYDSIDSENSFSIPVKTLKSLTKGKLASVVFITHYAMAGILNERSSEQTVAPSSQPDMDSSSITGDENDGVKMDDSVNGSLGEGSDEENGPVIASHVLSASVGGDWASTRKLPKSVSFVMQHVKEVDAKDLTLCSFWDNRQDPTRGFWSQDGCTVLDTNRTHTSCECNHMTNFAILLDVHGMEMSKAHQFSLRLITIIGCFISAISLLVSWVTFQCFASLQGERNSIHKNLALTLLVAELLFVFGINQAKQQILCSVIAGFLHFFFLAAFVWMFIEGLHIIFMLVQVFDASRSRLPYYYLVGYGAPLVVVGVSSLFFYDGYGTDEYCWLTTDHHFIWAFAGPVAAILLVNAVFLTYAMSTVCRHSDYVFNSKDKTNTSGIRAWVQGALALEVLLGLTWTLGYFLINEDSMPLAYGFAILNSLQGLFIFIFHCLLNKKAQKEYRQVIRNVVRRSPSTVTTQSTITKRTNHTNNSHELNHSPSNSHQKLNSTNSHSLA